MSFLRGYSVWEMKSYIPYLIYVRIHTYVYLQKTWPFFEVVNYKTDLLQILSWPITSSSTLLIHCLVFKLYYVVCSIQFCLFYKSTLGCVIWHIWSNASCFKNACLRLEVKMLLDTIMLCICRCKWWGRVLNSRSGGRGRRAKGRGWWEQKGHGNQQHKAEVESPEAHRHVKKEVPAGQPLRGKFSCPFWGKSTLGCLSEMPPHTH